MMRHLIETYQDQDGTVSNARSIQASVAIAFTGPFKTILFVYHYNWVFSGGAVTVSDLLPCLQQANVVP